MKNALRNLRIFSTRKRSNESGFTLIELIVVMAIVGILAVMISEFYSRRLVDYARNFTLTILQTNTKQAIESMERDIKAARSIEAINTLADNKLPCTSSNQYCWQSTSTSPSTLVLAVPARDTNQNLLYRDTLHNVLVLNEVIYYIDSTTKILYRRTIANPIAGNAAVSTCPPSQVTASCPSDSKVVEDVANMVITYYDSNNGTVAPGNSYSVDVTIQQTRKAFGRLFTNTLTSRASLRNKL